jgi:AcrR family transcriptional regulator
MEKESPISPAKLRILEASFNAFNQKGFQAVSMDTVSRELKISKKTIYKYFGSKEELLEAALVHLFGQVEARLTALQRSKSRTGVLIGYYDAVKVWRLALSAPLREEMGRELPYLFERVETFERQTLLRFLIGLLKDMREDGTIDYPSPSREFAVAFFHLMGSLVGASDEQAHYLVGGLVKGLAVKRKKK